MFKDIIDDYKSMMDDKNEPPRKGAILRLSIFAILIFILGFFCRDLFSLF